jgi:hypothetical protein
MLAEPPRSIRRKRAILYVTTSAASARAQDQISRWRGDLEGRGVEIVIIDLEKQPTSGGIDPERVATTPVLIVEGERACARLVGTLEDVNVDELLDVVDPRASSES